LSRQSKLIKQYEYKVAGILNDGQIFNPARPTGSTCDVLIVSDVNQFFFGGGRRACLKVQAILLRPAAVIKERTGGAMQYVIPNRSYWSPAKKIGSIGN
jgi:hypothetical protein